MPSPTLITGISPITLDLSSVESLEFVSARTGMKQTFKPDQTRGYFQFQMAKAFPFGATAHGTGLHPAVVEMSFESLLHQQLNYEHQVAAYYKEKGKRNTVNDRLLGSVVAVDFPSKPSGGWKITTKDADAPAVNAVATFAKLTQGMNNIIGEHMAARHKWTVSSEVEYDMQQSGFAVRIAKASKFDSTPADMEAAGWDYVSYADAPEDLKKCFSRSANRITSSYQGREVFLLMGGISTPVHFAGVGLVRYGAEKTAKISRMTASTQGKPSVIQPFSNLADLMGRIRVAK